MAINPYFYVPKQPLQQTYVSQFAPLPLAQMERALAGRQRQQDVANQQAYEMLGKEFNFLEKDREKAFEAQNWLNQNLENLADKDLTTAEGRREKDRVFREASKRFGRFGDIGSMQSNFSSRMAEIEAIDKQLEKGDIDKETADAAKQFSINRYGGIGEGGELGRYSGYQQYAAAQNQDIFDIMNEAVKGVASDKISSGRWQEVPDPEGKGRMFFKDSYTKEYVTPEEVQSIAMSSIQENPAVKSHLQQRSLLFGEDPNQIVSNQLRGVTDKYSFSKAGADQDMKYIKDSEEDRKFALGHPDYAVNAPQVTTTSAEANQNISKNFMEDLPISFAKGDVTSINIGEVGKDQLPFREPGQTTVDRAKQNMSLYDQTIGNQDFLESNPFKSNIISMVYDDYFNSKGLTSDQSREHFEGMNPKEFKDTEDNLRKRIESVVNEESKVYNYEATMSQPEYDSFLYRNGLDKETLKSEEDNEDISDLGNLSDLRWKDSRGRDVNLRDVVNKSGVTEWFEGEDLEPGDIRDFKKKISVRRDLVMPNGTDNSTIGMKVKVGDEVYTVSDDVLSNQRVSEPINNIVSVLRTPGNSSSMVNYNGMPLKVVKQEYSENGTSFNEDNTHKGYVSYIEFPGGRKISYPDFLQAFFQSSSRIADAGMGIKNVSKGGLKLEDINAETKAAIGRLEIK